MKRESCVLVTGGLGFIGQHLVDKLVVESELPVVVIDSIVESVHSAPEMSISRSKAEEVVIGDICSREELDEILRRWNPTEVFHLASETGTAQSATRPSLHVSSNILGTAVLLEALEQSTSRPEGITLTSSRAIYGEGRWVDADGVSHQAIPRSQRDLEQGIWNPRNSSGVVLEAPEPHAISTSTQPSSVYATSKVAQEELVRLWTDRLGTSLTVLRLQNVYGPGQSKTNPYTGIIPMFAKWSREGKPIPVFEDGNILRDFVHVRDVVGDLLAYRPTATPGLVVRNCGTGVATSILGLAELVSGHYKGIEPVVTGQFRHGDVRSAFAGLELLGDRRPRTHLAAGLTETLTWIDESE